MSFLLMGYLSQKQDTKLIRKSFFPIPFLTAFRLAFGLMIDGQQYAMLNIGKSMRLSTKLHHFKLTEDTWGNFDVSVRIPVRNHYPLSI